MDFWRVASDPMRGFLDLLPLSLGTDFTREPMMGNRGGRRSGRIWISAPRFPRFLPTRPGQEHPEVAPQVLHFRQVPFRTRVIDPQAEHGSPS